MKIALAHRHLDLKGGTERVLYRTAQGLRERGHEVHLFCSRFRIAPPAGVIIHQVPYLPWPRTARLLFFALLAPKIIARHSCDVVMSFDRMVRQDVFRSGGGPHRLFVEKMITHSNMWRRLWYRFSPYHRANLSIEARQMSAGGTRKIIAVCTQVKHEFMDAYGVPEESIVVIHNGIDLERFHPRNRQERGKRMRETLGIPSDRPLVLFVGTGFRRKGLDRLLRLWDLPELKDVYLVIVGNDARLPYYRRRWRRSEILFVGAQQAVEDYFGAADLFVLPSVQEAFGNVALEALACGVPVITVQGVGAVDKLDGPLREGILLDPDDLDELKRKIVQLLDPHSWPLLSREARRVAEKYSWDDYLEEIEKCLCEFGSTQALVNVPLNPDQL